MHISIYPYRWRGIASREDSLPLSPLPPALWNRLAWQGLVARSLPSFLWLSAIRSGESTTLWSWALS